MALDGKNLEIVLLELGIQMHREIYEHILSFTVNSTGLFWNEKQQFKYHNYHYSYYYNYNNYIVHIYM